MANGLSGLLGSAGNKLQGLLSSPVVQGVGTAAAFGFNPLLGLLAAPGFKNTRDRRSAENELLRQEIRDRARKSKAQDDIGGLLRNNVQLPDRQMGLLNVQGGVDMVSAPNRMAPEVTTPEGQQRLLGLLSQASPESVNPLLASSITSPGDERAEPSAIREMRTLGFDLTPEGFAEYNKQKRVEGATDEMLRALNLQMQGFQLDELQRKREEEEQTAAKSRRSLVVETNDTIKKAEELADLNDSLEETWLATGQPAASFTRDLIAGGAPYLERFGVDTSQARQTVADFDRFNKLATDFGIGLIERLRGTGTISNQKFQALRDTMAGIGTSPGANRLVIADVLQAAIDAADIEDIDVANRRTAEKLIARLRGEPEESDEPSPSRRFRFNPDTGQLEQQ